MLILKLCQWPPQITAGYRMEPEHEGGQLFCEWVPRCSEFSICPVWFEFFVWVNAPKVPWVLTPKQMAVPWMLTIFATHLSSNRWKFPYLDMIFLRDPMKHDMNFLITEDVPEKKEISIPHP